MAIVKREKWNNFDSHVIFNEYALLRTIPEFGGKIVEIIDLRSNYQWLWQDNTRPFQKREYGDSYDSHDVSGFDECFPNIGISKHPSLGEMLLPDHGELWTEPWNSYFERGALIGEVRGHLFKYKFRREISLNANSISFNYEVHNESETPFSGLWSAHPLLIAREGMSIEISGYPTMTKEFSFSSRMGADGVDGYAGHLDEYVWPMTRGENLELHDLSKITLKQILTDKVVIRMPSDGGVTLQNPHFKCSLSLQVNPKTIPYLGVCFNLGAYPWTGTPGTWVALEPTSGPTDRVDECWNLSDLPVFAANSITKFSFQMTLDNENDI